jgi:acyl-CoA synthetase (AMP-forming)/AMP-acid ligase II
MSGEEQLAHPKSCGRALAHFDIAILDEAGNPVPSGECGELCVRGPSVMAGYLHQPQATAETLAGGWLHTGDLFSADEDGYLTLLGRKKELIKSGGENVYPREVEAALLSHPDVLEAVVFGVPHEKWGEAVKAVVAPRPGTAPDVQSLMAWCRRFIARYKCPRFIEFMAELPRADTGKLLMRDLRARPATADQSTDHPGGAS